jgi:predicted aminopeptidase
VIRSSLRGQGIVGPWGGSGRALPCGTQSPRSGPVKDNFGIHRAEIVCPILSRQLIKDGMIDLFIRTARTHRTLWLGLLFVPLGAVLAGCQTMGYYKQAIQGQYEILANRQPISQLIANQETPLSLKQKLSVVLKLREFARTELRLPANQHYLRYVDLHRRFVVWNVHAAPELSLHPKTWWYPIVGSLEYRGYFSEPEARSYAAKLGRNGFDVYVEGVEAYSTLGWFADPVLNTFIHHEETELAEIIFHELAHQRLFVRGDTDFNEAFATAVAQEGVRRWLRQTGQTNAHVEYLHAIERNNQFVRLIMDARERLALLYENEGGEIETTAGNGPSSCTDKPSRKRRIIDQLRKAYEQQKSDWGGYAGYDRWFAQSLNNAQLNTVATYYELVPAFERLLQSNSGDLEDFYRDVHRLGKLPKRDRHRRLFGRG